MKTTSVKKKTVKKIKSKKVKTATKKVKKVNKKKPNPTSINLPLFPLSFYVKSLTHVKLYRDLTPSEKLYLYNAFEEPENQRYNFVYEHKEISTDTLSRIPSINKKNITKNVPYIVGYFSTKYDRRYKYIIGIVQYFETELVWIDFLGVHTRKEIDQTSNLSDIISNVFDNLIKFYKDYLLADVLRINQSNKDSEELKSLMAKIMILNHHIDKAYNADKKK